MARKRIKTFAQEWGTSVDEVLATCARLKLGHAHSDSSLLTPEEADRVKRDLDEQAQRQELLRRETVVETSAGKVVEKRLNATVMRRRHTEPEAGFAHAAAEPDEPFHFELESEREEAFATPFLEERKPPPEPEIPPLLEAEPSAPPMLQEASAPHPEPIAEHPAEAPSAHAAPNGAAAHTEAPKAVPETSESPAADPPKPDNTISAVAVEPVKAEPPKPERVVPPPPPVHEQKPLTRTIVEPPRPQPPGTRPVMPRMQPSAGSGVRRIGEVRPQVGGRTINLTSSAHAAAPSLDDGQRGPRVLGKIELPKPAPRPSAPVHAGPARLRVRASPRALRPPCLPRSPTRERCRRPARRGQARRAHDQEKARRQKGRARLHGRARDARPARAQEAPRDAR